MTKKPIIPKLVGDIQKIGTKQVDVGQIITIR